MMRLLWPRVLISPDGRAVSAEGRELKKWPEELHESNLYSEAQRINISRNLLNAVPLGISEKFLQLRQLDLSHNHLIEFPEAALSCHALEQLNVEWNCITSIPETLPASASLMSLFCGFNFIRDIPECLSSPELMPKLCAIFLQENYIDVNKIPAANRAVFHGVEYQRVSQEIVPGLLWLGPKAAASDIRELQALGITDIIIASSTIKPHFPGCFNYKTVSVDDTPSANIRACFDECLDLIEEASTSKPARRVLVHCNQGVSRSATLVVAHVMRSQQKTFQEAMALVQKRRYVANPNAGFRNQLQQFEVDLRRARKGQRQALC